MNINEDLIKKKMKYMCKILNKFAYKYYVLNNSEISDFEYDILYNKLLKLEKKFPKFICHNSPTQNIGFYYKKNKVIHKNKMYSLNDCFIKKNIYKFDNFIKKFKSNIKYCCELKIDGLAISLEYKDGEFVRASTRGNGIIGEDITENLKKMSDIPLKLKKKISIEVFGECYMTKKDFNKLNFLRKKEGKILYANARNIAAGSLRCINFNLIKKRKLNVFVYSISNKYSKELLINSQKEVLNKLYCFGFNINKNSKLCNNINDVIKYIEKIENNRKKLSYFIDGIVIKVDDLLLQEKIGFTIKYPKWAIAYKFPPKKSITKIIKIKLSISRNGIITPIAIIKPIFLDGSLIKKANLHNFENLIKKNINVGNDVVIYKAGDIIPFVSHVVKFNNKKKYKLPNFCPCCNSKLFYFKDKKIIKCLNIYCDIKIKNNILHFVSRDAMNINGIGFSLINKLYNNKLIYNIFDLYFIKLKNLLEIINIGFKKAINILKNINESKKNSLEKLIFGLGIFGVGYSTSYKLAKYFKNLYNLSIANEKKILKVDSVGKIIAKNIILYFKINKNIIKKLKKLKINFNFYELNDKIKNEKIKEILNKNIVLTGKILNFSRYKLIKLFEKYGIKIKKTITNNTDILFVGNKPGNKKILKAKKNKIKILKEDYIKRIFKL